MKTGDLPESRSGRRIWKFAVFDDSSTEPVPVLFRLLVKEFQHGNQEHGTIKKVDDVPALRAENIYGHISPPLPTVHDS